jgi:hypothetical protein
MGGGITGAVLKSEVPVALTDANAEALARGAKQVLEEAASCSNPAMIRSKVDFPHPEAPSRQTNSPLAMSRSMPRKASTRPLSASKIFSSPLICNSDTALPVRATAVLDMVLRTPAQEPVVQ